MPRWGTGCSEQYTSGSRVSEIARPKHAGLGTSKHPAGAQNLRRHARCLRQLTSTAIATAVAAAAAVAAATAIAAADGGPGVAGASELLSSPHEATYALRVAFHLPQGPAHCNAAPVPCTVCRHGCTQLVSTTKHTQNRYAPALAARVAGHHLSAAQRVGGRAGGGLALGHRSRHRDAAAVQLQEEWSRCGGTSGWGHCILWQPGEGRVSRGRIDEQPVRWLGAGAERGTQASGCAPACCCNALHSSQQAQLSQPAMKHSHQHPPRCCAGGRWLRPGRACRQT